MVSIILIENIPFNGKLILNVYFEGYKDSYQNDARRKLLDLPERNDIKCRKIKLKPLEFSIIRMESTLIKRGIGISYQYKFKEMTPENFEDFLKIVNRAGKSLMWWGRESILINVDEVPYSGILIFTVYFTNYKEYSKEEVKTDTEKLISEILDLEKDLNLKINLKLTEFNIIRMILGGVSRIIGVSYRFKFSNMDENKFSLLNNNLKNKKNEYSWWNREVITIAEYVGGSDDA